MNFRDCKNKNQKKKEKEEKGRKELEPKGF